MEVPFTVVVSNIDYIPRSEEMVLHRDLRVRGQKRRHGLPRQDSMDVRWIEQGIIMRCQVMRALCVDRIMENQRRGMKVPATTPRQATPRPIHRVRLIGGADSRSSTIKGLGCRKALSAEYCRQHMPGDLGAGLNCAVCGTRSTSSKTTCER